MTKILCFIGFHDWKQYNSVIAEYSFKNRYRVMYYRRCLKCDKQHAIEKSLEEYIQPMKDKKRLDLISFLRNMSG